MVSIVPFCGRCVNAGTLMLNYDATYVAPIRKDQPSPRHFLSKHISGHGNEQEFGYWSRRDQLCW
jgi:hypothetical protein